MKKPTPKKKQSRSSSSRRYKVFQNRARAKMMGRVDSMLKLKRTGKLTSVTAKSDSKVTKVKA